MATADDADYPRTAEQLIALPESARSAPDLIAFWIDDAAPMSCVDADGQRWLLGRHADGRWCKRRA